MSQRALLLGCLLIALALMLAGCGPAASPGASSASTPALSSPVDGVVVAVDASGLTQVHGFTLRTSAGTSYTFTLGALENATQFSPSHVAEHMATSIPVRVYFIDQDGARVVYRLEDAPNGSPAAS
jgi:hypothetical protein